jgi:NTE family protein
MDVIPLSRPVGFVLGGGDSLGAVQVGMLQALFEQDIVLTW